MSYKLPEYITISDQASIDLKHQIDALNPDKIAVLVDENTKRHCLEKLEYSFDVTIEIESGERNKNLNTCEVIWKALTDASFTRKSLLVNLGGGVIGDMGGFAASTYKRGIRFISIPTTLLSQVDASIGGKLGIDFGLFKNHIGLFQNPNHVIIDPSFLTTLSLRELKSGYAEVLKHSLIYDKDQWDRLKVISFEVLDWKEIIPRSVEIKHEIVGQDPLENGLRKILNFGHTLGHAIESHFLASDNPLLHGEAVAIGMMLESHISYTKGWISKEDLDEITHLMRELYSLNDILPDYAALSTLLIQDKKNVGSTVSFSLIEKIGKCLYDITVSEHEILESLQWYNQMKRLS